MMDIQINNLFNKQSNSPMAKPTKLVKTPRTDPRVLSKIHEILNAKGLDPTKLGRALGYTGQQGGKLMSGEIKISVDVLLKIAEILDVSSSSLLPGENPGTKPEFEEYIWESIKRRLDKYLEEKFKELSKKK